MGKFSNFCKLLIVTRINKDYEADVFMPPIDEAHFEKFYVTKTYSQKEITFDYCFYGNKSLFAKRPELIPTRLVDKYPKHPEM